MSSSSRRPIAIALTLLFITALVMGPGPGMLLVNRPSTILGIPALYAWGLFWYVVEVFVVVAAYFLVWNDRGAAK